jgi:hypothetical protein
VRGECSRSSGRCWQSASSTWPRYWTSAKPGIASLPASQMFSICRSGPRPSPGA